MGRALWSGILSKYQPILLTLPSAKTDNRGSKMEKKTPRYVPLVSGIVGLAAATAVLALWSAPSGFFYWVRGTIFGLLTWYGIWNLKVAAFASDDQIRRATSGDVDVWKESEVAMPSAFKPRDVIFTFSLWFIFVVIVGLIGFS
jgi:hypothetical protein